MVDGYIDRNRLLKHLNDWWLTESPNTKEPLFMNGILQKTYKMEIIEQCMKVVEEQPTADVVEVVHGEWIEKWDRKHMVGRCFCNSCRRGTYKDSHLKWIKSAYCPNCGAKMDGKRVE